MPEPTTPVSDTIPRRWPGLLLGGLALALMLATGYPPLLALAVMVLWSLSFWLTAPRVMPPAVVFAPAAATQTTPEQAARAQQHAVIEPLGLPVVMIAGERVIAANAAARAALGAHITGQDARVALRHPDAVRLIEASEDGSVAVRGLTGAGSLWQLTRRTIDARLGLIELVDRTAEADIGRAHTDFVANASHELRTPLAAVIGYIETLAEDGAAIDGETRDRFLSIVLREARRMQSLVADLISLSQLEAEKHDAPTTELDLGLLAARVVGEFTAPGSPTAGRLTLARPDTPILVIGDARQLEQMLRNLIDNAFKYGDAAQPVVVELRHMRQTVRPQAQLAVIDRGAGIAAHHVPHLTRRFYRTDPGRSRAAGGTGLGLAIVKHIVERHRGRLDIASQVGVGTVVTVRLPLVVAPPAPESPEPAREALALTTRPREQAPPR